MAPSHLKIERFHYRKKYCLGEMGAKSFMNSKNRFITYCSATDSFSQKQRLEKTELMLSGVMVIFIGE